MVRAIYLLNNLGQVINNDISRRKMKLGESYMYMKANV